MALIQYAAPWDRQPQEAVEVDWDNPIAKDLAFLPLLSMGRPIDLVSGRQADIVNGTTTAGAEGIATVKASGNTKSFVWTDFGARLLTSSGDGRGEISIVVLAMQTSTGWGMPISINDPTGFYPIIQFLLNAIHDGATQIGTFDTLTFYNSVSENTPIASSVVVNKPQVFGYSRTLSNQLGYVDGVFGASSVNRADPVVNASSDLVIQGRSDDQKPGADRVWFAAAWNRALSAAEHASIANNPWQLFAPQTIWVPVSAGGGTVTLAAQDAAHAHALDNAALSIGVTLTVADLAHGHALDASTLSTGTALAVADAQHAHALDNVTLSTTGATSLTVVDLLHAHTLDAVVLTSQTDLAAADMAHGHALDGVTLTLGGISLVIAEIMHAHALDNVALTLDTYLAVADILHAHTLDNVLVSIPGSALSDAEFRQMYDWISELHLVHGLRAGNPLTVTPTTRAAGIVDQTIGEVGTTVTVTRI